jgi:hypothetical protein
MSKQKGQHNSTCWEAEVNDGGSGRESKKKGQHDSTYCRAGMWKSMTVVMEQVECAESTGRWDWTLGRRRRE